MRRGHEGFVCERSNDLGLSNISNENEEGSYLIRHMHGPKAVRDVGLRPDASRCIGDENLEEKAVPCLFPYGRGGTESSRPVDIQPHHILLQSKKSVVVQEESK